jgi:short-subunit dehydrogenase
MARADRQPECWIVLGASSSMARAFARVLAEQGDALILCGRDGEDLARLASDTEARGAASARAMAFDCRAPEGFAAIIEAARAAPGRLSVAVFAGSMPPQAEIDADPAMLAGVIADSHTGPATFLQMLAPELEARGVGTVIGVGSVAGDRGRLPNYVYGAAKAAFAIYLSGLRNRLARKGVHVMTVKPGPTDTAMTWGLPGMDRAPSPEDLAQALLKGARKRRNVLYVPFKWRIIMAVIRSIPEPLFKKLKF